MPLNPSLRRWLRPLLGVLSVAIALLLTSCSIPQVSAEDRLFLNLSVDFLGEYQLPQTTFADTSVGGLSALTYDRQRDRFYALSDDHSQQAPARFYTLKLELDQTTPDQIALGQIEVEQVTYLKAEDGQPYPPDTFDPEGIALSPRQTVFISDEGNARAGIGPRIDEFDLETGAWQRSLPIPERYLPQTVDDQPYGIQHNLGFEALTLNPGGYSPTWLEPFRLFAATEGSLRQDLDLAEPGQSYVRFLHYLIGDELPTLLAEHLYALEPVPLGTVLSGLSELLVLDQGGHFLSLERTLGITGFDVRIFQIATGGATDTSGIPKLTGDLSGIVPIRKRLLLGLKDLGIRLDNLEGMTLGPQLPDGSPSLLLVSDDNFNPAQVTQFLLFRLNGL